MRYVVTFPYFAIITWSNSTIKEDDDQGDDGSEHPDMRPAARNRGRGRRRPPGIRFTVPVSPVVG